MSTQQQREIDEVTEFLLDFDSDNDRSQTIREAWQAAQASLRKQLEEAMEKDSHPPFPLRLPISTEYPNLYAVIKGEK